MRILITAAEEEELITFRQAYNSLSKSQQFPLEIIWMLTGIGTTSASYRITKMLNTGARNFDLAVNIGIAGTFSSDFPIGTVARIEKEYFGDLGFETFSGFQTLFEYNILDQNTHPFKNGALYAPELGPPIEEAMSEYKRATSVTVQTVSGLPERTDWLSKSYQPHIESMEGAAFFYVCALEKVPFIELRSVSNIVGERDRSKWDIPLALDSLRTAGRKLLSAI
ncbi:MAG: futalosine hydrolase [Bacteroidales bacterium]|nr:futalosine hydrolase [Bacteroidales bacterium]MDD2424559.1 futalosine hydrolase [Bacteroidales bacterium]MDD3988767.1 futalosine hydrolase [Bacteroidales bacterium]MDD4638880.1 futalosine hydrolase [Bacteroidales bacterium]